MTTKSALILALIAMLAACGNGDGTNPVNRPDSGEEDNGGGDDGGGDGGEDDIETADESITRYEEQNEGTGDGYAQSISYDPDADTFTVDNLGFDGDNVYVRDNVLSPLGPFAVYEASETFYDSLTGNPITQLTPYKAIYGVSESGNTEFAIVRTGAFVEYGFGGWVISRDGSVTLPTSGQATYAGDYAGLRDFTNRGGIEYTTGEMTMSIDFEDFNAGDAVKGSIFNREIYDSDGQQITDEVLAALGDDVDALPTLNFVIGPGALADNGEVKGEIGSFVTGEGGALEQFESGNYYAVLSGDDAEEVVGVIVVTSDDPRFEGVTARETGGFLLAR